MFGAGEAKAHLSVHGSDNTKRAFSSVRKNITGFNSELKRTALTFATAFGAKQLMDMSDSLIDLRNRLMSFNNDAEKTAKQIDLIGQVALRTRASFDATGVVFTRMVQATQHLSLTSEELAAATATVNATFKLSGTTAYEAANSARQLAQGLSSGRLSGDEMRSVLENNVVLANLLADGFGKTVGQLRIMGAAGKVTTEKIMPILIDAFEETTTKVNDMQFTIDAAFQVLQTRLMEGIKIVNKNTQAYETVANALGRFAMNLHEFVPIITGAVIPALIALSMAGLRTAASFLMMAVTNPLVIFGAIGAALANLLKTNNVFAANFLNFFIPVFTVHLPNALDYALLAINQLAIMFQERINNMLQTIQPFANGLTSVVNLVRENLLGLDALPMPELKLDTKKIIDNITEIENRIKNRVFEKIDAEDVPDFFAKMLEPLGVESLAELLSGAGKQINAFAEDMTTTLAEAISKQKSFGQEVAETITKGFDGLNDALTDFVMNGKLSIKDLARTILNDLVSAMIRASITTPLQTGFSEFLAGLEKKQGGGQVIGRRPYIVGEQGAELFIPSSSGNIVSNKDLRMQEPPASQPVSVNFSIQATDSSGFDELLVSRKNQIVAMISQAMNQKGKVGLT
jgi:tape measure domain-containing protein